MVGLLGTVLSAVIAYPVCQDLTPGSRMVYTRLDLVGVTVAGSNEAVLFDCCWPELGFGQQGSACAVLVYSSCMR